jgi:hypothetical protein
VLRESKPCEGSMSDAPDMEIPNMWSAWTNLDINPTRSGRLIAGYGRLLAMSRTTQS